MRILTPEQFNFEAFAEIPKQKKHAGNPGTRSPIRYKDIITAFDIETSRIKEIEQSIMYVWQWAFDDQICVMGRTWEQFTTFCEKISETLKDNERLIVFVHNLSYEFQFLKGIYKFSADDVFALDNRKILKCVLYKNIEMRCSYIHSNMNLKSYLDKFHVKHKKLDGEAFDYGASRWPWTPIIGDQLQYCINDVIGLVEAVKTEMESDGDNIYTFPLTSTGYVRRDAKKIMKKFYHGYAKEQAPNLEIYIMLKEAFRGGNTHASRYASGKIVRNVTSVDRSSSYPDVLVNHKYPGTAFRIVDNVDLKLFNRIMNIDGKAVVFRVRFTDIELRDPCYPCPYLTKDKCRNIIDGYYDNGRILGAAGGLETTLTDIDYRIVKKLYKWRSMEIINLAWATYKKLPKPFTDLINSYYVRKTALKGIAGRELEYTRFKGKINALYGMCAFDACKIHWTFDGYELVEDYSKTTEELLEEDNRKRVLPPYAVGVWCTAWARWELQQAIDIVYNSDDAEFIYTDTDSVKYTGHADFSRYNARCISNSEKNGAFAVDQAGNMHYMGVFENEGTAREFKTYGAKKYCYTDDNGILHLTVAGVIKDKGARELEKHGGINAFNLNFTFIEGGGLEAIYNDDPEIKTYTVDGHTIDITSNVVLRDSVYTLGITEEYEELLRLSGLNDEDLDIF